MRQRQFITKHVKNLLQSESASVIARYNRSYCTVTQVLKRCSTWLDTTMITFWMSFTSPSCSLKGTLMKIRKFYYMIGFI